MLKMNLNENPRSIWLFLYIFTNIIAGIIMFFSGELIGDVKGNTLDNKNALILATILNCFFYYILLGPFFSSLHRIKIKPIIFKENDIAIGDKIGNLLIIFQIFFMIFNITFGVNIAGSNTVRTSNPIGMIFIAFPVDILFFIYYGNYRKCKKFYPNLFIYLLSNISRGWSGQFLIVIFFELCNGLRKNKIKLKWLLLFSIILFLLLPIIINIKWFFRANPVSGNFSINTLINGFNIISQDIGYLNFAYQCLIQIIGRLQTTSMVVEVIQNIDFIQNAFSNKEFVPFWHEGLHGILLDKLNTGERSTYIGLALTQYIDNGRITNLGDWNVNIGFPSWFFIAPLLSFHYLFYVVFLCFLSYFLSINIGNNYSSKDMLWLAWLIYLLPPWFNAFVQFIYALFVFLVLKVLFYRLPNIRFFPTFKLKKKYY